MNSDYGYAEPAFSGWIGVAREDVTPPVGITARNWGAARHDVAVGIHRPLTATALALSAAPDEAPLLLIALDLGWWRTRDDEWRVRSALLDALALNPANVVIALSHTHAGPSICREDATKPGGHLVGPYLDHLRDSVIRAARMALASGVPALLTWGQGRCGLAQNRDLPDPKRPRLLCGFNPAADAALHPDDALLVGRVTRADGSILATLVNYACHPTTLAWENPLISPDYVGALREGVEAATGDAPCLFLQGASGELAPRRQYTADTMIADANGEQVGYAVLSVLRGMLPPGTRLDYEGVVESGAPLAVWNRAPAVPAKGLSARQIDVELPLKAGPNLEEVASRLRQLQQDGSDPVLVERLLRRRRIMQSTGTGPTTTLPLWGWRIGDALLIAQPNEAYAWLQQALRKWFHPHPVLVLNIANGPYCGYLPPAALYDQDLYPVWQTPYDIGCLELIYDAACSLLTSF